eukprot:m.472660 g.472660  ORF g.472660 m.472660 type:complete len:102 (-) comp57113_c0_seq1:3394-3699(-)
MACRMLKLLVIRAVVGLIGLFWSVAVILALLATTIKKRGANLKRKQRQEPEALRADTWGKHVSVRANGLDFHCVVKGTGPLMLFLHGFPEVIFHSGGGFGP